MYKRQSLLSGVDRNVLGDYRGSAAAHADASHQTGALWSRDNNRFIFPMPPRRRYCYILIICGATAIRTLKLIITPLDCCGLYLFSLGRGLPLVVPTVLAMMTIRIHSSSAGEVFDCRTASVGRDIKDMSHFIRPPTQRLLCATGSLTNSARWGTSSSTVTVLVLMTFFIL